MAGYSYIRSIMVKSADVNLASWCRLDWSHSHHRCVGAKCRSCLFVFRHIFRLTALQHELSFIARRSVVLGSSRKNSVICGCLLIISADIRRWGASNPRIKLHHTNGSVVFYFFFSSNIIHIMPSLKYWQVISGATAVCWVLLAFWDE